MIFVDDSNRNPKRIQMTQLTHIQRQNPKKYGVDYSSSID